MLAAMIVGMMLTGNAGVGIDDCPDRAKHTMTHVEEVFGEPDSSDVTTCGGGYDQYGDAIPTWPCVLWSYPYQGDTIVLLFNNRTKRLWNVFAVFANGKASTSKFDSMLLGEIHRRLHRGEALKPL